MSIDTVFKPGGGPLTLLGTTPIQIVPPGSGGTYSTFRVRCLVASYFSWAPTAAALPVPAAPTAGVPILNTIGMLLNSVEVFEIPPNSFFVAANAAAFEFLAGQGA